MVHSIELVFDDDTESAIRRIWSELAAAGLPAAPTAARPHVTLLVAPRIHADVDAALTPVIGLLPLDCRVGPTLLLGRSEVVLARSIVPTAALLDLHAEVHRVSAPHLMPGPMPHVLPGQWTAHVTVARRVELAAVGRITRLADRSEIVGRFVGLRRWDGESRTEYLLERRR